MRSMFWKERHLFLQIIGGADLFLQGVVVEDGMLPHFAEGDLLAIKVAGNPFPFAVGTTEVSSEQAARAGEPIKMTCLVVSFPIILAGLWRGCIRPKMILLRPNISCKV